MKFFINIIAIVLLAYVAGVYFPWWSIAIIGFVVSLLLPQKPGTAFFSGFFAVFLLWLVLALLINSANGGVLAGRIGMLLGMGNSPVLLAIVTGIIGGLVTGLAALSASYLRQPAKK